LCCVYKTAENSINGEDEECMELSDESDSCNGKDSEVLFQQHQRVLSYPSEKTENSYMKELLTVNTVIPNTDASTSSRYEFIGCHSSTGTVHCSPQGCVNSKNTPGKLPPLSADAVEPTRHNAVVKKQYFIEPGTSQESCRGKNLGYVHDELEILSDSVPDNRHQCKVCGYRFKRRRDLERHMTIHTGEKPYKCRFCDKKFRLESAHKMHELRHKGELPQCGVCGGRFVCLVKHMLIHSTDSYKHICSVCQKAFRVAGRLKRHMLTHTGEKPYTCQDCGGRYRSSTYLKKHIRRLHAGDAAQENNHVCSVCGKAFPENALLNIHMRIHTGEKPYKCETCGKAFAQKAALDIHRTVHSSEMHFVCSTCGKRFKRDCALRRHNLIHTGEQPFECSVCKMRFNQSNSMQRHMLTHTGEKPYSCSDCRMRFTQSGGLASHRLRYCPERRSTDS